MATQEPDPATEAHVAVDCYVRADAVSDPLEADVAALRRLERDGTVDDVRVRVWPSEVVVSPLTEETLAVRRYRTFREWAAQWAVRVEPPFRRETRRSEFTGETREVLRTPALCVAVRVNGRLREVFPHRSQGTTYSVGDAVDALERGAPTVDGALSVAVRPDHCPECDVPLSTGQGLYACPDCEWVGVATGSGTYRRLDADAPSFEGDDGESEAPSRGGRVSRSG